MIVGSSVACKIEPEMAYGAAQRTFGSRGMGACTDQDPRTAHWLAPI